LLTQKEADHLLGLEKKRADNTTYNFPVHSELISMPIISTDGRESFLLDINRGSISLKCTYQNRYNKTIVLVRVDLNGPPHTNPDVAQAPQPFLERYNGKEIPECHMHLYVEGYFDKWAIPMPDVFNDPNDIRDSLDDFFKYCNVIEPPKVQKGLY